MSLIHLMNCAYIMDNTVAHKWILPDFLLEISHDYLLFNNIITSDHYGLLCISDCCAKTVHGFPFNNKDMNKSELSDEKRKLEMASINMSPTACSVNRNLLMVIILFVKALSCDL